MFLNLLIYFRFYIINIVNIKDYIIIFIKFVNFCIIRRLIGFKLKKYIF